MNKIKNNIIASLAFLLITGGSLFAQKIAVVDITNVLQSMEEYTTAQEKLDVISAEWRQDISQEYDDIKSLYNKFQAEQVLLSDELKREREDEIMQREKQVRELQRAKFGPEGELFRKREELVSPIQEKVFSAIQDYAAESGIDIMLDKSSAAGILFTSAEFDKTDTIKRKLGIRR